LARAAVKLLATYIVSRCDVWLRQTYPVRPC